MRNLKMLVLSLVFVFVGFSVAQGNDEVLGEGQYYARMPLLVYSFDKKEYLSYTDKEPLLQLINDASVVEDIEMIEELKDEYTKNNQLPVLFEKVKLSSDGKYAFVRAYLRARYIPVNDE